MDQSPHRKMYEDVFCERFRGDAFSIISYKSFLLEKNKITKPTHLVKDLNFMTHW